MENYETDEIDEKRITAKDLTAKMRRKRKKLSGAAFNKVNKRTMVFGFSKQFFRIFRMFLRQLTDRLWWTDQMRACGDRCLKILSNWFFSVIE